MGIVDIMDFFGGVDVGCCVVGDSGIVWFCGRKKKENRGITIAILRGDSF